MNDKNADFTQGRIVLNVGFYLYLNHREQSLGQA